MRVFLSMLSNSLLSEFACESATGVATHSVLTIHFILFAIRKTPLAFHKLFRFSVFSRSGAMTGKKVIRMGDHPIAWTQCIGNGRSFYTAIGHRPEGYSEPNTNKLLQQGVAWAAGLGENHCRGGKESGER